MVQTLKQDSGKANLQTQSQQAPLQKGLPVKAYPDYVKLAPAATFQSRPTPQGSQQAPLQKGLPVKAYPAYVEQPPPLAPGFLLGAAAAAVSKTATRNDSALEL